MSDSNLSAFRILLIIGGGIAAYKALELIRRLRERGASVQTIMTRASKQFVTPLSVGSLSGRPVREDLFDLVNETEMGHIELSRSADLVVVAPATADLLAKMANGLADDLASTTLLATNKRVLVAPAMNVRMWTHPSTQRNVARLASDGIAFVGPETGDMACGEFGPGRMAEPLSILDAIVKLQKCNNKSGLEGRHILVTAGPTYEPIDPVRYIGNRSSGLQGFAIARAAASAGARVSLVSGPVTLADPTGIKTTRVETAREMLAAVRDALPADVFIGAAAVADWRVRDNAQEKIKKSSGLPPELALVENPDILATVAKLGAARPKLVIGFAAETRDLISHAREKLLRKGCDYVVANSVAIGSDVFGGARNEVHVVTRENVMHWPIMSKDAVAHRLIDLITSKLDEMA